MSKDIDIVFQALQELYIVYKASLILLSGG